MIFLKHARKTISKLSLTVNCECTPPPASPQNPPSKPVQKIGTEPSKVESQTLVFKGPFVNVKASRMIY